MNKQAYYTGKAARYATTGLDASTVKLAFINEGLSSTEADYLLKEAGIWSNVIKGGVKGLQWAGRALRKPAANMLHAGASRSIAPIQQGAQGFMRSSLTKGTMGLGKAMAGTANNLSRAATSFGTSPWRTMGSGIKNFGAGALMFGGKGTLGGGLGRAAGYASLGTMTHGLLSRSAAPQMRQAPRMYSNYLR